MNYFELFDLPEAPIADKAAATKKYFELQKKYHPDFYTNESEEEKENAELQSAAVNKAYQIFQHPDKTIEYFLQQKNIITADEKYNLPPDFLMEMMELNESFDDSDAASVKARVSAFEDELAAEVKPLVDPVKSAQLTDADLQQLKAYYYKKKYLKRILERLYD